jgi:predicted ATPase/class 3 adenylate cyclase
MRAMTPLPVGTVTFLFTDIEGSTRLVQQLGGGFGPVLEQHHAIVRTAIASHSGVAVSTEGDAFFAAFPGALDAVRGAAAAQRDLAGAAWPPGVALRVRMGVHTGQGQLGGDNYVGLDVHRAARIAAAAHGGEVLLSEPTRALVIADLPGDLVLRDVGRHRLKDLVQPEALYQLVIRGLPDAFPPPRTLDPVVSLVVPPNPLVGRERELADLDGLLRSNRLVTITGPGGIGKTRLATEVGLRAADRFADGVTLVELEGVRDPGDVAAAISRAVGAASQPNADPEGVVGEWLRDRQVLLIVDNFEQVAAAAPLLGRLLTVAPRLMMIVASRTPLHLTVEQEYPLGPLGTPQADGSADPDRLGDFPAVALFVQRAKRARPDFRLTDANAATVAAICRRVDGLPLAIELAAARIRLLSPDLVLERLTRALPMLVAGDIDRPARQRALTATIAWSYDLLEPGPASLFRRLAIFGGGASLEAAEAVTRPDNIAVDVLDGLAILIDQSLVRSVMAPLTGQPRFELLQLVREFALDRLTEAGEREAVVRRHATWVCDLVEAAAPDLEAGANLGWLDRLAVDNGNIDGALAWTEEAHEVELGLRIASAAWRYWQQRGYAREGTAWLERLLALADDTAATAVRAAAETASGGLAYWRNDLDAAETHYRTALALDAGAGLRDRLGNDTYNLAFIALTRRDLDQARQLLGDSAGLFEAAGQHHRLADTTAARGAAELRAGNLAEARTWMEEGRRLNLAIGNRSRAIDNTMVLSTIYQRLGDGRQARRELGWAARSVREVRDEARWPLVLEAGAMIDTATGQPARALRLAGAAARHRAKIGGGPPNFVANLPSVVEQARAAVTEQEGPGAADRAWGEGESLADDALLAMLEEGAAGQP